MPPSENELTALLGTPLYDVWTQLCASIEERYEMDRVWNKGGKACDYEYKFEAERETYTKEVQTNYDETRTYHDGKWIMFEPVDTSLFQDFMRLLHIKRKPNRA